MQFLKFVLEESQVPKHIFVAIVKRMINAVCLVQKDKQSRHWNFTTYAWPVCREAEYMPVMSVVMYWKNTERSLVQK